MIHLFRQIDKPVRAKLFCAWERRCVWKRQQANNWTTAVNGTVPDVRKMGAVALHLEVIAHAMTRIASAWER
jgi:hypothetical protein